MKILVVEDEPLQRELLQGFLERHGYEVLAAPDGETALAIYARTPVQLVLLDHKMPGISGKEVLERIKRLNPLVRVIMITAYGEVGTAVSVMKLGADDYLEKPVDLDALLQRIRETERLVQVEEDAATVENAACESPLPVNFVAESPAMKEVLSLVRRVAPTPWAVLVRGETGTGKELIARLVHLLSPRKDGPFVEVNCAAIPEGLFESELFGHERGAFTGAVASRRGRFELAHMGTLFLDEIGELPLGLQSKLLRTLQEKRITRMGSERTIEVDARIVTATNRDLKSMMEKGEFREDLYYRLNVFEIEIPPLRQRKEDIRRLVELFVARDSFRPVTFSPESMDLMVRYHYPGNIRELEHIVQRTVTLARGNVIEPADLPPEVRTPSLGKDEMLDERTADLERTAILNALDKSGWVQTRAAIALGISERALRYKMDKYGIKRGQKRP